MNDSAYDPVADVAIRLYNLCTTFNTLPKPGGILDQDSYQIWLLELVNDAVAEKQAEKK